MTDAKELLAGADKNLENAKRCRDYAKRLAVSMHCKFYPENESWQPLDDIMGLLTQIDNMVTGLSRIIPPRQNTECVLKKQVESFEKKISVENCDPTRALSYLRSMFGASEFKRNFDCTPRICCHKCNPQSQVMIVCPDCGNKRCPKASDHELDCTGSNEPGQPGSIY